MSWDPTNKTKENYFWIGPERPWEEEKYGFYPRGMGDILYNTYRMIVETNDKSWWARQSFEICTNLLKKGLRWPIYKQELNEQYIAKNWFEQRRSIRKYERYKRERENNPEDEIEPVLCLYRPQTSITRDPYIMMRRCAVHLGIDQERLPRMPWHLILWRRKLRAWENAMRGKKNMYLFFLKFTIESDKQFVKDLERFMREAYEIKYNINLN